jgi:hypothetical protein
MTYSPIVSAAGAGPAQDPGPGQQAGPGSGSGHDPYAAGPGTAGPGDLAAGQQPYADPGANHPYADPGTSHPYADPGSSAGQDPYAPGPGAGSDQDAFATQSVPEAAQDGYAGPAPESGYADYPADSGQEAGPEAPWPHQSYLELAALPTAAPCARLHTNLVLREWHLDGLVQTATQVVAELVSNAVQASTGLTGSRFAGVWAPGTPPVRMWLSADEHRVVIQVWDGSDRPPAPQPMAPEADSGRGLLLVGALSAEWGCYTPEKSSGKVVWAVVGG